MIEIEVVSSELKKFICKNGHVEEFVVCSATCYEQGVKKAFEFKLPPGQMPIPLGLYELDIDPAALAQAY